MGWRVKGVSDEWSVGVIGPPKIFGLYYLKRHTGGEKLICHLRTYTCESRAVKCKKEWGGNNGSDTKEENERERRYME